MRAGTDIAARAALAETARHFGREAEDLGGKGLRAGLLALGVASGLDLDKALAAAREAAGWIEEAELLVTARPPVGKGVTDPVMPPAVAGQGDAEQAVPEQGGESGAAALRPLPDDRPAAPLQDAILEQLAAKPRALRELPELVGKAKTNVHNALKRLVKAGIVERVGTGRRTRWRLVQQGPGEPAAQAAPARPSPAKPPADAKPAPPPQKPRILTLLRAGPLAATEIAKTLDMALATARVHLHDLKGRGQVEPIGQGRLSRWRLVPAKTDTQAAAAAAIEKHLAEKGVTRCPPAYAAPVTGADEAPGRLPHYAAAEGDWREQNRRAKAAKAARAAE